MSNIEPDEDKNYTEKQWDNLPVAKRMRLCASGEYEIQRSDMTDAADRIEKLESELVRTFNHMMDDTKLFDEASDRIEKLEAALRDLSDGWECCTVSQAMRRVARDALEGKND